MDFEKSRRNDPSLLGALFIPIIFSLTRIGAIIEVFP